MGKYLLSISIPTYNFGEFIGQTLESIREQASEDVEVVVLDGGSTDSTPEVVRGYVGRIPGLRYYRQEWRGGIDRDIARTVELSTGEYCWLFSSDDIMRPGAISRVLRETNSGHDVYLLGRIDCTRRMRPIRKSSILAMHTDAEFELSDAADRALYFSKAQSTYAFFAYMSSIVVRKARWDQVPLDETFVGSCWAHVARLFKMIPEGLHLKYLSDALVLCRGGNDSFLSDGVANRVRIAVQGFHRLGSEYFGRESYEAFQIRRALRNEYRLRYLYAAKARAHRSEIRADVRLLDEMVGALYNDPPLSNRAYHLLYILAPARVLDPIHRIYKALSAALGY